MSVTEKSTCSVIIVTYQSQHQIAANLDSLICEMESISEIVVADNSSTDNTLSIVSNYPVRVVRTGGNLGYAAAINIATRTVPDNNSLLILNPDIVVSRGAVSSLLAVANNLNAGIVVPRIVDRGGRIYPSLRNEPSVLRAIVDATLGRHAKYVPPSLSEMVWSTNTYGFEHSISWATGAALLISPQCRDQVGEWDSSRFFLYSEETDYFRRARDGGFTCVYAPASSMFHEGGASGASASLLALMAVNRVQYFAKYHGAVSTEIFRWIVLIHEASRAIFDRTRRLAVRALRKPPLWQDAQGPEIFRDLL